MNLLSLIDALTLDAHKASSLYAAHINKGLLKAFRLLGTADMDIESAEGAEIRLRNGTKVLDFSSAIGVLGLGHNHPRILAAERLCHERKLIDALKVGPLAIQSALAYNLAQFLPEPLEVSFFTTSGAEAVEAAMKLCEKAQGPRKRKFITTTGAFHGKTHGALSLTRSESFQDGFLLGVPPENVVEVHYGDLDALRAAIEQHGKEDGGDGIIAFIVEPLQGQGVLVPPPGYLRESVELCHAHQVLVVFDEVKVGIGRAGTFCAFQQEETVPDAVTLSKALGGGKRAIGAMVTSKRLFQQAYGKRKDWASHTTTFGGLGESCAVAVETLNVLHDEGILGSVCEKGAYLKERLMELQQKHCSTILEVRGLGLLLGVRLNLNRLAKGVLRVLGDDSTRKILNNLDTVVIVCIVRELYRKHNVITHFSGSDPDVLHVMPPLIVEKHQLDRFIDALDQVLSKNIVSLAANLLKSQLADAVGRDPR